MIKSQSSIAHSQTNSMLKSTEMSLLITKSVAIRIDFTPGRGVLLLTHTRRKTEPPYPCARIRVGSCPLPFTYPAQTSNERTGWLDALSPYILRRLQLHLNQLTRIHRMPRSTYVT